MQTNLTPGHAWSKQNVGGGDILGAEGFDNINKPHNLQFDRVSAQVLQEMGKDEGDQNIATGTEVSSKGK